MHTPLPWTWRPLLLSLVLLLKACAYPNHRYACIIDAGSSGSRVRVYEWPTRASFMELPQLKEVASMKRKPGISKLVDDDAELEKHVQDLVNIGKMEVPVDHHEDTPIYLMATAGTRLLLEERANKLIEKVRNLLERRDISPFEFRRQNARILSGEEEGAYAWVAVNYLRGAFADPSMPKVGVLELGGASTQIAFQPAASILADKYPVRLAGRTYQLYVHSYLHYGIDYTILWIREQVLRQNPQQEIVYDPCMLKGDETITTIAEKKVVVKGSGNYSRCYDLVDQFVYSGDEKICWPKPCAIGTVYQPTITDDIQFYAIAAFYFGAKHLRAVDEHGKYSPGIIREKAQAYCAMNITEGQKYSEEASLVYVSSYCLQGVYQSILFNKAYRLPLDQKRIKAVSKIHDKKPAWVIGALLSEIEKRTMFCIGGAADSSPTSGLYVMLIIFSVTIF